MKNANKGLAPVFIIIIILGVLVTGGGVYFLSKDSNSISKDTSKEESYFSGKISDMFKNGKSLTCSTKVDNPESSVNAVYYFDNVNKLVRVDMQVVTKSSGSTINTVSIVKDNWNYFWDDLTNKDGMKIKFDESQAKEVKSDKENISIDMNKEFDFVCKSWIVDSTKFDLPKDKSFKDLSDIMNQFSNFAAPQPGKSNSTTSNYCNLCNMIPEGSEKNNCLSSCK